MDYSADKIRGEILYIHRRVVIFEEGIFSENKTPIDPNEVKYLLSRMNDFPEVFAEYIPVYMEAQEFINSDPIRAGLENILSSREPLPEPTSLREEEMMDELPFY